MQLALNNLERLICHKPNQPTIRVFHISVSWWSFTGVWVTTSRLKSPQVSRALLSILANLNNTAVWLVSTRSLISKISSLCINPLVTVPRARIVIGITVTFMFHSFFQFLSKVQVLILLFAFFQFYSVVSRDSKVHNPFMLAFFCWLL